MNTLTRCLACVGAWDHVDEHHPVAIPVKYAAEKDGVVWLIGCIGILLWLLFWGPQIDFSDAAHLGELLGGVVAAFALIFLFGLIGSKIAGKSAQVNVYLLAASSARVENPCHWAGCNGALPIT